MLDFAKEPETCLSEKAMADLITKTATDAGQRPAKLLEILIDVEFAAMVATCDSSGIGQKNLNELIFKCQKFLKRLKLTEEEVIQLSESFECTIINRPGDALGGIAAHMSALEKSFGQYFTPHEVAFLSASLSLHPKTIGDAIQKNGVFKTADYTCGSGSMLIAIYDVFTKRGYKSHQFFCEAKDIDPIAAKMCAVQLHLKGIPARIICGDSIFKTQEFVIVTGALMKNTQVKRDLQKLRSIVESVLG